MVCETEAVLPKKISSKSLRVEKFDPKTSEEELCLKSDLIREIKDFTQRKVTHYQDYVDKLYNSKMNPRDSKVNDLVLREAAVSIPSK